MPPCTQNPCKNNGTCMPQTGSYTCLCKPGYTGQHCEVNVNECASNPCRNEAICVDKVNKYLCFCVPGFQGYHCEIDINECASKPCQNNGTCINSVDQYECDCATGYTARMACKGLHLVCVYIIGICLHGGKDPYTYSYQEANWMHQYMVKMNVYPTPVKTVPSVRTTLDISPVTVLQGTRVSCANTTLMSVRASRARMEGSAWMPLTDCDGSYCVSKADEVWWFRKWSGRTCVHANTNVWIRTCDSGLLKCEQRTCMHGGTCLPRVRHAAIMFWGSVYECKPWRGYSGDHCNVDINECSESPCENGALCLERSNQSYYGQEPEFGATFSYSQASGYVCRCKPGFTGDNCVNEIDECESEPCQNSGSCIDFIDRFSCHCAPGYTGLVCSIDIDECEDSPCENGATCVDVVNDYLCICPAPVLDAVAWGGKNCSIKLEGCKEHRCQNEAVCIPTYEENIHNYICKCQPGYYGKDCSIQTTFSFTSNGYILYDLHTNNRTKRGTEEITGQLRVRFRTTLPDMVLMYQGNEDNYLILELYDGVLHLEFWRNSTHLVLSDHRLDDGYWHEVEVLLDEYVQLILYHDNCTNGMCSKKQHVGTNYSLELPESFDTLYIGGLVEEVMLNNTLSRQNFTGCMGDLIIDFRIQLPHNFTRLSQMEFGCNKTDWCHPNPCHHGALCIDLWTRNKCECIRPYKGPTCTQEYTPGTFFREDMPSYAMFTVPQNIGHNFNVSTFIRTLKLDGLLMAIVNGSTVYFRLFLQNGRLHVATLTAPPLVFKENLADGRTYFVNVSVKQGLVTITHLKAEIILGEVPNLPNSFWGELYVGGVPVEEATIEQPGGYFKGCLQDVRINNHHLEFFKLETEDVDMENTSYPVVSSNITQDCISDNTCDTGPCKNEGTCTVTWNDFTCKCPSSFTGKTCEEPLWCEKKPCPSETMCEDVPGGYVCLANATFLGGHSVIFSSNVSTDQQLTYVSLNFRTRDKSAVLLKASKDVDYISIAIHDGHLQLKLQTGNSVEHVQFVGTIEISDATWHRLVIKMDDPSEQLSKWIIQLDNVINIIPEGRAGSLNFLRKDASIVLAENYTGCLGQVTIGGIHLLFTDNPFTQPFIRGAGMMQLGCKGSDVCSKKPCLNNGECRDLFNAFSCTCRVGWEGQHCEVDINECKLNNCTHGWCENLVGDYKCICDAGYTGRNCETDVDDCQNHQCQNGGSCIDGVNSYTCKCSASYAGNYCQWPFPPEKCNKSNTCLNGGVCNSGIWGANCTCRPGFSGRRCEVNINDCESNPCLNGGTCQDSVNNFKCICISNYSGVHCEKGIGVSVFPLPLLGIAVPVLCGVLLLLVIVVIFMVVTARKRRQSEGTYSPSQQEVAGARLEMDSVLKVPPEERLI
ncbi:crumbs homolog 2 isoform X5 [Pelobates cultripes]|uniref:Crumbs homolog 2 isoform X5 n=1 Tax=Pelobates cultripes TaxID=61616 RepID=A0AAD1WP49_PELCU|nr:crumbs homolog 2 isoform X5 [Pelobates cultripes]